MKKNNEDTLNVNTELILEYVSKRFKFGGYVLQPTSFNNTNYNQKTLEKIPPKVCWHHFFIINFLSEERSKLKTRDNFPRVIRYRPIG